MSEMRSETFARQHVIDPEICIRCNTCEATCPLKAISHDSRNYVVDFDVCNGCGACLPPCPTGAIDNWRDVPRQLPFSVDAQLSWDVLPAVQSLAEFEPSEIPQEIRDLTQVASSGHGVVRAPHSAAEPCVNLYTPSMPVLATVAGNLRLTGSAGSADVRHIVLDFGSASFPVLEGQTIGIVPPGQDPTGKAHFVRLYSVASPRDGERSGRNNLALTIKRVTEDHHGNPVTGVGSNYLCDLQVGAQVQVVGPYGSTFLMPNHPGSSLLMICTGTGSAPMRAMTEYRRRRRDTTEGGELMLFFGARSPEELPYFGPLMKLPREFIDINLAFSRVPGQPKCYVQDLIRARGDAVLRLVRDDNCFIFVCGLKSMEHGVLEAFSDVCRERGIDWSLLKTELTAKHRLHIETY